ncbi:hypothetical protein C8T65DRAFT_655143 [Cerioporus squamosus]|nr:hypothetical protein C8T65DRAFT_655143 [Cerioporus squamosus]
MPTTEATESIILYQPDSHNPPIDLDLEKFMGTWHVTHSTLPLWRSRKDVTITYALKTSPSDESVKFDDIVEYRSKSNSPSSTRSRVVGIDTLMASPVPNTPTGTPGSGSSTSTSDTPIHTGAASNLAVPTQGTAPSSDKPAPTRYKWRGKGWLMIASSRWQLLGCSRDPSAENPAAWAVTYFEKTLFTPAGLDIYSRTAQGLPDQVVQEIVAQATALGGDVAKLAEGFFEVERSGISNVGGGEDQGKPQGSYTRTDAQANAKVNKVDVLNHIVLTPS